MASKGKKISLFDASGMLTKDALLGYVFNDLTVEARQEVDRQLAENEMYRDMVEGFKQINNRAEVEHIINEMNLDIAERSGSTASVPGLGENVGEFFWNYRRVAAVVGGVLLVSAAVLTFALFKVSNPDNNIALNKEKQEAPEEIADRKREGETTISGNENIAFTPPGADAGSSPTTAELDKAFAEDIPAEAQTPKSLSGDTKTSIGETLNVSVQDNNGLKKEDKDKSGEVKQPVGIGTSAANLKFNADSANVANQDLARADDDSYLLRANEQGYVQEKNMQGKTVDQSGKNVDGRKKEEVQTVQPSIQNTFSNSTGTVPTQLDYKDMVLQSADVMPAFPGGDAAFTQYLTTNLRYPEKAKKDGVQGNVYVSFIIGTGGKVKEIAVIQGVNKEVNAEAIRLIANMPKWEPGQMQGQPVQVQLYRTIEFKLPEEPAKKGK